MACKWYSVCPLREWEREGRIDGSWRKGYCESDDNWKRCKRYQMEERGIPHDDLLPNGESI